MAEIEPTRWQVLDATQIRAVFDLREAPRGLYDVTVINADGTSVIAWAKPDGGVQDLNKIQQGRAQRFLSTDPDEHLSKLEALAMPFRFNIGRGHAADPR